MSEQIITKILDILDQKLPLDQTRNMLHQLQSESDESANAFILKCTHALYPTVLPTMPDGCINEYILNHLTPDDLRLLESIVTQTTNTYFKGVYGELIWQTTHNRNIGEMALNSYNLELDAPSYDDELHFIRIALAICRIYSRTKYQNYNFQSFFKRVLDYVTQTPDSGYLNLNLLHALFTCSFAQEQVIATLEQVIDTLEKDASYAMAATFSEKLIEFYRKTKCNKKSAERLIRIAELYEKESEKYDVQDFRNAHQALHYIQLAMNAWLKTENHQEAKERRKLLVKKAQPLKALQFESLKPTKIGEYDISEPVNHMRSLINTGSFEDMLVHLINLHKLKTADDYLKRMEESGFVLSSLFSTNVLDESGHLICIVPSLMDASSDEKLAIAEYEAGKEHSRCADAFTSRFLHIARSKYTFTDETLRFLVDNNAFVPDNRKDTFLKGLVAGFNFDLATAMHLLMPQVENAIRYLAELCGAVVYKTQLNGVEECLSLESILKSDEVKDSLDPELIFNMQVFYTSQFGIGMRNIVSHGLRSDKALQNADSLAVWWFTLRLVCLYSFDLRKRLQEQKDNS